jgi:signal transduction histidine kinase
MPCVLLSSQGDILAASPLAKSLGYVEKEKVGQECLSRLMETGSVELEIVGGMWRLQSKVTDGGIVVVAVDIGCEIARRQALRDRLKSKEDTIGRFLRHDLKTPLATTIYRLEQSVRKGDFGLVEKAIATIKRTAETVDRSGYLYGKGVEGRTTVKAVDILYECVDDLNALIAETQAQVSVFGNGTILYGEVVRLRQVFLNLIGNAVKFVPKARSPIVTIRVSKSGAHTKIEVEDNGEGIPTEFFDKIFQPMERLHSRSGVEGEGLGLAIVREVVEEHGGEISVSSVLGVGSTFTVLLPQYEPTADSAN